MPRRNRLLRWLMDPSPAGLGIEFRPREIVLARFAERRKRPELDLCLKAPVPDGVIEFSMLEPNIRESEALSGFLRRYLEQAGVRGRRIALTLPDTLARISVVDLPGAPRSRKEVTDLLRFRVKKSLPFGADRARVAFQPVADSGSLFLTGVMYEDVISQYETLLEGLGFHVGRVEVASLSLLNLWHPVALHQNPPDSDYFFINVEEQYFSVILVRSQVPILVRTLGHRSLVSGGGEDHPYRADELVQEIVPTVIYYREKLGGSAPARVYYRCLRRDLPDVAEMLETQFDTEAEPFDLHRAVAVKENLHVDEPLATAVGAAAGAAMGNGA